MWPLINQTDLHETMRKESRLWTGSARLLGKVKKWKVSIINYKLIRGQLSKVSLLLIVKIKVWWFRSMILLKLWVHSCQRMAVSALESSSTGFLLSMNEKPTQRQRKSHENNSATPEIVRINWNKKLIIFMDRLWAKICSVEMFIKFYKPI